MFPLNKKHSLDSAVRTRGQGIERWMLAFLSSQFIVQTGADYRQEERMSQGTGSPGQMWSSNISTKTLPEKWPSLCISWTPHCSSSYILSPDAQINPWDQVSTIPRHLLRVGTVFFILWLSPISHGKPWPEVTFLGFKGLLSFLLILEITLSNVLQWILRLHVYL